MAIPFPTDVPVLMKQQVPREDDQQLMSLERHVAAHPATPMFARLAALYLERSRPAQALKLCLQGVKRFPSYPTALLVMAQSQVMLRQYNDARETLHGLLRAVPGCVAGAKLLDRMTELELQYPPTTAMVGRSFPTPERSNPDSGKWSRRDDILPGLPVASRPVIAGTPDAADATAAVATPALDLSLLAARLEGARIPALPEESDENEAADAVDVEYVDLQLRPQTETLAKIYSSQGRYREAIDAFRSLSLAHPGRAGEFASRIAELEERLASS